jgi:2-phospho-L-lactate guanylyltransferase (CobY/MobA/RfbA family)
MVLRILLQRGLSKNLTDVSQFSEESNVIYLTDTKELAVLVNNKIKYLKGTLYETSVFIADGEVLIGTNKCCVGNGSSKVTIFDVSIFTNLTKTIVLEI